MSGRMQTRTFTAWWNNVMRVAREEQRLFYPPELVFPDYVASAAATADERERAQFAASVGGDEEALSRLARAIAAEASGGPDAGVTLEDLKNAVKNSNIYALQDGRYYVALSLAEAESLRAALETTRAKLLAKEAEAAALRETVRHLRVRIATGGRLTVAGGPGATDGGSDSLDRAELEAAELARARRELEDRTAELVRLKGVLRGELLRRVLEDAETTRTSLGRLDVATDD